MSDIKEREQEFIRQAGNFNAYWEGSTYFITNDKIEYKQILNQNQLQEFISYWTEINPNGRKMRFEEYKDFYIGDELKAWKEIPGDFINAWTDWVLYKWEQFKFKYKSRKSEYKAMTHLMNISNKRVDIAIEIINQSIVNGWKGLFPLKNFSNGSAKDNRTAKDLFADTVKNKFGGGIK